MPIHPAPYPSMSQAFSESENQNVTKVYWPSGTQISFPPMNEKRSMPVTIHLLCPTAPAGSSDNPGAVLDNIGV
jgi:hypothetical protein